MPSPPPAETDVRAGVTYDLYVVELLPSGDDVRAGVAYDALPPPTETRDVLFDSAPFVIDGNQITLAP